MFIPFDEKLYRAGFLERPNRFLVRCRLEESPRAEAAGGRENNNVVEAHLADPGRLEEILIPGRRLWLRHVDKPGRKTSWSVVLGETPDGSGYLSLDSTLPNRLVGRALEEEALVELRGWSLVRPEYQEGRSRWDFLLKGEDGRQLLLEVKSVTLVEEGIGYFPDAVTKRGTRHLRELAELAGSGDWEGAVLFAAQRDDLREIRPAVDKDPEFAAALRQAAEAGVSIFGRRCRLDKEGIRLREPVPVRI